MIGASAKNNFNGYVRLFQNVSQSFNELRDEEKLNRQPELVRIKTVDRAGTLQNIFTYYQMPEKRFEELAVLNGMELNERIERGTLIKVVERGSPLNVRR